MSILRRLLTPALWFGASIVFQLAHAQGCNPEDQIWDNVRSGALSEISLTNSTAHARVGRKPHLENLL